MGEMGDEGVDDLFLKGLREGCWNIYRVYRSGRGFDRVMRLALRLSGFGPSEALVR